MNKNNNITYDYNRLPQGVSTPFEIRVDKRTRRFLEVIRDINNPKILEVGMGEGRYLRKISLLRPDAKLFGIDISKVAIDIAKKSNLSGEFKVGNAEKLPYSDNSFDVVVIADVLEHLNDPSVAIKEAERVLKPGGIFHFYVPCENQPFTLDWLLRRLGVMRDFTKMAFGHVQYFNHKDINDLTANFNNAHFTYSDHIVSQLVYFFTLYIPKMLVIKLNNDKHYQYRDSNTKKSSFCGFKLVSIFWYIFIALPAGLVSEIEALLFSKVPFTAKGLHFSGRKK